MGKTPYAYLKDVLERLPHSQPVASKSCSRTVAAIDHCESIELPTVTMGSPYA